MAKVTWAAFSQTARTLEKHAHPLPEVRGEAMFDNDKANTTTNVTDIEAKLVANIAEHRDTKALERLYDLYLPRVCGFLRRFTQDDTLIEDTYNEVMYRVWSSAHQYQGKAKVSSWIFSIAYRTCLLFIKRHLRQEDVVTALGEQSQELDTCTGIDKQENRQLLDKALESLPVKQRLVLELNYFSGFTLQEIAEITDSSINTVKTRLRYARHKLRESLSGLGEPGLAQEEK